MNKNGIIYIIISVIVVSAVAMLVLAPEDTSDTITVAVMNVSTVISGTETVSYTETHPVTTYTSATETEVSSFSTNTEPVTASAEPETTVYEEIYVDINTADIGSLMKIHGIGEVTAAEIISYREQNGGFRNIEEIMNVYGIGTATFEHICGYIYVENPVYDVEEDIIEEFPEPENVPEPETQPEITLENAAPININTADLETLLILPYVDEQIAQDIITLREKLNGYSHVYELLYIENLEQKQVAEMVNFVTVGQ